MPIPTLCGQQAPAVSMRGIAKVCSFLHSPPTPLCNTRQSTPYTPNRKRGYYTAFHQYALPPSHRFHSSCEPMLVQAVSNGQLGIDIFPVYVARIPRGNSCRSQPCVIPSTDNLAAMPGFAKMKGVAAGLDGRADPQSQLFRSSAIGVETGPFISQVDVIRGLVHRGVVLGASTAERFGDEVAGYCKPTDGRSQARCQ